MSDSKEQSFSRIRSYLWPVHGHELKKLIPMLLIFFLISFDYNVLRTMKDTLVVTAKASGAEVIPFIKVWVMFPGAVLMTLIFTKLSNRFRMETVIYAMMAIFLCYFALFTFVLFPFRDTLHPNEFADKLQAMLPIGFKGMVAMIRNWTFTLFYVMSELWGNIILTMLFWGFANQVTRIHEAKRFYGLFGIGANASGILAGQVSVMCCRNSYNPSLPFGCTAWEQSLLFLVSLVLVAGIAALILFRWMNVKVLNDPEHCEADEIKKSEKPKFSFKENIAVLFQSRYIFCIALLILCYNLVINLVEVVWKDQVRALYPNPSDYNVYTNQVSTLIGVLSTASALLISGNAVRKFGWTFTAMITPVVLALTSIGFFGCYFFRDALDPLMFTMFGAGSLWMIVTLGSAQNILCRGAKYSVFDATKEMSFVPLSREMKMKGKAAIDGIVNRLGKSGGSVIHQSLIVTFSSIAASAPYVAGFLFAIVGVWAVAVKVLGDEFHALTTGEEEQSDAVSVKA